MTSVTVAGFAQGWFLTHVTWMTHLDGVSVTCDVLCYVGKLCKQKSESDDRNIKLVMLKNSQWQE